MVDVIDDFKAHARILQRGVGAKDAAALARVRVLDELRGLDDDAIAERVQRRHCLAVVAQELGFAGWPQASAVLRGEDPEDYGTLLCPDRCAAHWNVWSATYAEARGIREEHGGYLLAFDRHYFIVDRHYIADLGLDPDDPDWERIGRDWPRPGDVRRAGEALREALQEALCRLRRTLLDTKGEGDTMSRMRTLIPLLIASLLVSCTVTPPTRHIVAEGTLGPYSGAVLSGDFCFVSGKIGERGGTFTHEAETAIDGVEEELANVGLTLADVVSATVYLTDMARYPDINEVYSRRFPAPYPARACIAVRELPVGGSRRDPSNRAATLDGYRPNANPLEEARRRLSALAHCSSPSASSCCAARCKRTASRLSGTATSTGSPPSCGPGSRRCTRGTTSESTRRGSAGRSSPPRRRAFGASHCSATRSRSATGSRTSTRSGSSSRRRSEMGPRCSTSASPGYNSDNAFALLRSRVLEHEPDVAVYVFFANDIDSPITWGEISPDQTIDPYFGFPLRSAFLEWALVRTKDLLAGFGLRASKRTVERSAAEWTQWGEERMRSTLLGMKATCEERGVGFRVVSYPFLAPEGRNAFRPIDEGVGAMCAELEIPYHDFLGAFDEGEDLRNYRANVFDHHPDGRANERVARFLAAELAGG